MTTIVASRDRMCADSRCNLGQEQFLTPKLFEVRGGIIGTAGHFAPGERFMAWWGSGRVIPKLRQEKRESFEALVLSSKGLFYYGEDWVGIEVSEGVMAIGTGAQAALCALRKYKATPWEAVEGACMADANSSLPVQQKLLAEIPKFNKRTSKG